MTSLCKIQAILWGFNLLGILFQQVLGVFPGAGGVHFHGKQPDIFWNLFHIISQ